MSTNNGFPLRLHATGQWYKRIKGKVVYFGKDRNDALERFRAYCSEHRIASKGGVTLRDAINAFLTFKKGKVAEGVLAERTYLDYVAAAQRFKQHLDLDRLLTSYGPDDFQTLRTRLAEKGEKVVNKNQRIVTGRGPIALNEDIRRLRIMLKFAYDERMIDRPVWGGQALKPLPKRVLRKVRRERIFAAEEIRLMLGAASPTLKAMILLGINGGMTPGDVAAFDSTAIDPSSGKVYFPRVKTGVERHFYLWPETQAAIKESGLPFRTSKGNPWSQEKHRAISKRLGKLMDAVGIERGGRNFYALRHTFQTIADAAPYAKAHVVRYVMGHLDPSPMSATYREVIDDAQLRHVTDYVRNWLFDDRRSLLQSKFAG